MYLKTLYIRQFRNYQEQQVDFCAPKTILVGNNAQGKSNLLEAVELLSTLKSHRAGRDRDLIHSGFNDSKITATLERANGSVDLGLILRSQGRRTVILNGEGLRRHIDFLGTLNAVQFSSLDLDLVRGAPERRRAWLDSLLTQIEPIYDDILKQYNQVLRQRNALLKQIKTGASNATKVTLFPIPLTPNPSPSPFPSLTTQEEQLTLWDAQLALTGSRVTRRRARVLKRLAPLAQVWHASISGKTEVLEVSYAPNVSLEQDDPEKVQQAFLDKIQQHRFVEQHHGTTFVGPHRDEVDFTINQTPARAYGSQGQQRTLVLALKLAELKLIEEVVGEPPLLLLDDVLAELDPLRQNQLLNAIQDRFQTLITTTHLGSFGSQWIESSQILSVHAGQVSSF